MKRKKTNVFFLNNFKLLIRILTSWIENTQIYNDEI